MSVKDKLAMFQNNTDNNGDIPHKKKRIKGNNSGIKNRIAMLGGVGGIPLGNKMPKKLRKNGNNSDGINGDINDYGMNKPIV